MPFRRLLSRLALGALAWAAMLGLWLLLVDSSATPEVVAGLGAAVIGAGVTDIVRRRQDVHYGPRPRWIVYTWQVPWRVVADCAVVMAALWRHLVRRQRVHGVWRTVPFQAGGDDPRAAAWRACAISVTSLAPNTYMIGIDRDHDVALVHQLTPTAPEALKKTVLGAS